MKYCVLKPGALCFCGLPPKLLMTMKLVMLILFTCLMQVSASTLAQRITLSEKNSSLEQVLRKVKSQIGYEILFASDVLDQAKNVTVNFSDVALKEGLDEIFENQPLTYELRDNTIIVRRKAPSFLDRLASVIANDDGKFADIRGVVRNGRGEALEGITVMVKGAKTGTRTNAKGEFVLKGVRKGDVLVFTGVAIEPFEYTVKDDKNIDLNLKARLVQLEEVGINTGYQKISKERYVGSYSQLDSAAFHRRAGMGILERLDGTVTGVLFDKKGGMAGGGYTNSIQIRGVSTLLSNPNPLIVVDNFPYTFDLSTINPNDVENVVVLKDAAATSIWGARAGNGVIVITTKKGKFNQPLSVFWRSNLNIQEKPDLYHYSRVNSSDFIDFEQFLFSNGAYDERLNDLRMPEVSPVVDILNEIAKGGMSENEGKAMIDQLRNTDIRNQLSRYVYQNGITQQHYLNIGGGSANANYSFSLGYNNDRPIIKHSKNDDQYTINSGASFKVGKRVNISTGISLTQTTQRSIPVPVFPLYTYLKIADDNGNALPVPNEYRLSYLDTAGKGKLLDWQFRPLDEIKLAEQTNLSRAASVNANISYSLTKWLNLDVRGQYNILNSDGRNLNRLDRYETRNLINRFTNLSFTDLQRRYPIPMGGILDGSNGKSTSYNLRTGISVNKNWDEHELAVMISGDLSEARASSNKFRFYGYQPEFSGYNASIDYFNNYITNFGLSSLIPSGNSMVAETSTHFVSLTANASYIFQNKYTIYGSARRDGANLFGVNTNNKWKPLWSLGAAWQIHKEKFFQISWIDQLNLKASYGYSGNTNNRESGLLTILYSATPSSFTGLTTATKNNIPNPNLRWEEVRFFNSTIDFSLFKSRITGSVQFFRKYANDLISGVRFAPSTGINAGVVNAASLKGNGVEFDLHVKVLDQGIRWEFNSGGSYAKMKVAKVYNNNFQVGDFFNYGLNPALGRITYGLSSYKWAGLDPETGDPQGYLNGEVSKDYLSLLIDSVDNQIFHGSAIPTYSGFLFNTLSWKNLSLSFNISYKLGFYFRKPVVNYNNLETKRSLPADYYLRWQHPGDEKYTNVPSMINSLDDFYRNDFYTYSEVNVLRGDHVRLQDIGLQYNFQPTQQHLSFLKNVSASVYINNLNLMLWRKEKSGLDPDFAGTDDLLSPPTKMISIGLTAKF